MVDVAFSSLYLCSLFYDLNRHVNTSTGRLCFVAVAVTGCFAASESSSVASESFLQYVFDTLCFFQRELL